MLEAFGVPGLGQSIPTPGDYFGTGQTDIAVYLVNEGEFAIRNPAGGPDQIIPFGIAGTGNSIPAPGDYDGSGRTELGVYLPSLGAFAYRPADGAGDVIVPFGIAGQGQSIPAPGDYDGSGHDEFGVYLPNLGIYAYRPADGGPDVLTRFGPTGTDQTLPDPYLSAYRTITSEPGALTAYFPSSGAFGTINAPSLEGFGIPGPGQTLPVTVVDEALVTGAGSLVTPSSPSSLSVEALSVVPVTVSLPDPSPGLETLDFLPVPLAKKARDRF